MNPTPSLPPDDPRLTAYALGELEGAEREAVDAALAHDPVARATVEEIRATAAALDDALAQEPVPIAPDFDPVLKAVSRKEASRRVRPVMAKVFAFPRFYYLAAGVAAACFALIYLAQPPSGSGPSPAATAEKIVQHGVLDPDRTVAAAPAQAADTATAATRAAGVMPLVPAGRQMPDRFFGTHESSVSSFPLQVGRAAYAEVRAAVRRGVRPARDIVHVAEMINAFNYTWPAPEAGEDFSLLLEETAAPWAENHRLVRVGLQAAGHGAGLADARVTVAFNPENVRAWRLIGFEHDAGAVGVNGVAAGESLRGGDTVTALYEIVPVANVAAGAAMRLRFELAYRETGSGRDRRIVRELAAGDGVFSQASPDLRFAAAVAAYGLTLRGSPWQPPAGAGQIAAWAANTVAGDPQRSEFLDLVQRSRAWLQ